MFEFEERFWSKVDASASCWEWTASLAGKGYGKYSVTKNGKTTYPYAHRYAWESLVGPIPDGMDIDHLCKNIKCVNPDHLEPVSRRENLMRSCGFVAKNAVKTHCPQGHEFTEDNTYVQTRDGYSGRSCLTCRRVRGGGRRVSS